MTNTAFLISRIPRRRAGGCLFRMETVLSDENPADLQAEKQARAESDKNADRIERLQKDVDSALRQRAFEHMIQGGPKGQLYKGSIHLQRFNNRTSSPTGRQRDFVFSKQMFGIRRSSGRAPMKVLTGENLLFKSLLSRSRG
jgi:hypothetical protein